MKKLLLLSSLLVLGVSNAQEETNNDTQTSTFNKWSVDVNAGLSKPTTPFVPGYYTENTNFFHVDLGARYMFNPKFGFKLDLGYDSFENEKNSADFKGQYYRTNLQGVVNLGRVLNFEDFSKRINFQIHAGPGYSFMKSNNFNGNDEMVNLLTGLTGQFKLSERVALNADFTMINNIRQTYSYDGTVVLNRDADRAFNGTLYNATLGLSIYLGKNDTHADWYFEKDDETISILEDRIAKMETMMNDTDRDGVPDYLDAENNTTTGVAVDTKGRAVDLNKNGVPDELERYIDKKLNGSEVNNNDGSGSLNIKDAKSTLELINQGYISVFFDTDSFNPKSYSTNVIYFVINYLKSNPSANLDIIGSADSRGNDEYNKSLSQKRAEKVKSIIEKAGIDGTRLNIVPQGEDNLGDGDENLSLVRRVNFKIK